MSNPIFHMRWNKWFFYNIKRKKRRVGKKVEKARRKRKKESSTEKEAKAKNEFLRKVVRWFRASSPSLRRRWTVVHLASVRTTLSPSLAFTISHNLLLMLRFVTFSLFLSNSPNISGFFFFFLVSQTMPLLQEPLSLPLLSLPSSLGSEAVLVNSDCHIWYSFFIWCFFLISFSDLIWFSWQFWSIYCFFRCNYNWVFFLFFLFLC